MLGIVVFEFPAASTRFNFQNSFLGFDSIVSKVSDVVLSKIVSKITEFIAESEAMYKVSIIGLPVLDESTVHVNVLGNDFKVSSLRGNF